MNVTGLQQCYVVQIKNCASMISSLLLWDTYLPPFSMTPLVKNNQWVLFMYDGCLWWWYLETQGWTFIGLRELMKEGLFMSACFCPRQEMIDLCGEVLCQYGRKI